MQHVAGSSKALPLPLQPLLLWQVGGLLAVTGTAAAWHPWPAAVVASLALWLDERARRPAVALFLLLCWLGGAAWGYGSARHLETLVQPLPPWAVSGKPVTLEGRVLTVQGLPDDRERLLLEQVRPAAEELTPDLFPPQPLAGHLAWTRYGTRLGGVDTAKLLPGQWVRVSLRLRPLRDPEAEAAGLFWMRQGVAALAFSSGDRDSPEAMGAPAPLAFWRERLRAALVRTLDELHPLPRGEKPIYGQTVPSAPQGWGILVALLFGDRQYLGYRDMERFNHAGLAHSLALSGQHLAVVGLGGLALALLLGRLRQDLLLKLPRFKLAAILSLPLALIYLWLGNAPPSLLRATLMLVLWTLFCLARRPCGRMDLLATAFILIVLADPLLLHDLGLRLSFAAVAGLALALPLFHGLAGPPVGERGAVTPFPHRLWLIVWAVVCGSTAVHLASIPLLLDSFGRLSPWSVLNVLWLPVLGLWVLPLAFLSLLCLLPAVLSGQGPVTGALEAVARFGLDLSMEPCRWLTLGLGQLDDAGLLDSLWGVRPHWTSMLGAGCLLVALSLLARRPAPMHVSSPAFPFPTVRRLLAAGVCLLLTGPLLRVADGLNPAVSLRLLDVGQGQSVAIGWQGQNRVLVDGGGSVSARFDVGRDRVVPELTANAPLRVNGLLLSHPHADHLLGLLFVARKAAPRTLALPQGLVVEPDSKTAGWLAALAAVIDKADIRHLRAGDEVPLGRQLVLEVLFPPAGYAVRGNEGLVLRLARLAPESSERTGLALLTGDAPVRTLQALLDSGRDLRAEVLVAPHHGSDVNFVPAFIEAVAPQEVWASLAYDNTFGFPGPKLQAFLAARGIPLRTTAQEGTLEARWP